MDDNKNKISKYFKRGFSLIELTVVVVVICVLASVMTISYNGIKAKAYDNGVLSDINTLDAFETSYALRNGNVAKKFYYSGSGESPDAASLGFRPTAGNVIDVVVSADGKDYCIRSYNPNGTKNTIENAYKKESVPGICDQLDPSVEARGING